MASPEDIAYPLASSSWDGEEIIAMQKVIASGQFTMGEHVARFANCPGERRWVR